MKRYHIVLISTAGYHLATSYATMAEAVKDMLSRSVKSFGCVLRDGTNGKRYSIAECRGLSVSDDIPRRD